MIKRHSRNSLHLLIDSEQRKKNQQFCDNDTSDDTDGEDNDDDDVFSDGSRQLRRHLRSCCGDRDSAMGSPVRFKDVAFYEEPGILMIVQSIGAEQQDAGTPGGSSGTSTSAAASSPSLPTTAVSPRAVYEQRKRATHLNREYERDEKWGDVSSVTTSTDYASGTTMSLGLSQAPAPITPAPSGGANFASLSQADSLPVGMTPLPAALKVETTNRFTSLVSRPVLHNPLERELSAIGGVGGFSGSGAGGSGWISGAAQSSGRQTPHKRSSITGTDRHTFFKLFTAMIKSNQLSASDKWERGGSGDPGSKYMRDPSHHVAAITPGGRVGSAAHHPQAPKPSGASSPSDLEGMRYENKTNDVIWLELQAWFAGLAPTVYDKQLVEMRKGVTDTIREVLTFKFETNNEIMRSLANRVTERGISVLSEVSDVNDISTASDQFYDAQESLTGSLSEQTIVTTVSSHTLRGSESLVEEEIGVGDAFEMAPSEKEERIINPHRVLSILSSVSSEENDRKDEDCAAGVDDDDTVRLSLDVFNGERVNLMNRALDRVSTLLSRLEDTEQYYASTKMFRIDHPAVGNPEFQARVKCLCMWYNLTRQLRSKIDVLGHVLLGLGASRGATPWPTWAANDSMRSQISDESGILSPMSASSTGNIQAAVAASTVIGDGQDSLNNSTSNFVATVNCNNTKVRFKLSEEEANSTNPSDSNNSTSTDSGAQGSAASASGGPGKMPGHQGGAFRQISTLSVSSSLVTESSSQSIRPTVEEMTLNPYRKYVEKYLKTKGLRKTMATLNRLIRGPLRRAKIALERPLSEEEQRSSHIVAGTVVNDAEHCRIPPPQPPSYYHPHLEERYSSHPVPSEDEKELTAFGTWNFEFRKMRLPSFRAPYLFLCRVPLDVIHDCLKIRLEQKPQEPSELSIRQLMRECKEVLRLAVIERQKYISRVKAAIYDTDTDRRFLDAFEQDMEEFDQNLVLTLEVYLSYLQSFVTMIQSDSSLLISTYQKSLLEEEWTFIKQICPNIPDGESFSCNTFCQMACGMLKAIGNFLNSEIDEVVSRMFVYPDSTSSDEETLIKHQVYEACRGFQSVFGEARERAIKALAFAKTLRKDLEVSAEFTVISKEALIQRLQDTGHIKVVAPHSSQHQIFIPGNIRDRPDHILQLLDMHCGSDQTGLPQSSSGAGGGAATTSSGTNSLSVAAAVVTEVTEGGSAGVSVETNMGYLVLMKCEFCAEASLKWSGDTIHVKPTAETTISLSQIEVDGLLLIAPNAARLTSRRKEFMKAMRDVITLKHDQRATSHKIAFSLEQVKQEALCLRDKISRELSMVEEKCDVSGMGELDSADKEALSRRTREILHQCYKFGFEYHKELDRLVTGQLSRAALSKGVVNFAHQWMRFVIDRCDRGKGTKPRWAFHGIDFLLHAASPNFTRHLTAEEFSEFKSEVEVCYAHVIGEAPAVSGATNEGGTGQRSPRTPVSSPGSATNLAFVGSRSGSRSRASSPIGRSKQSRSASESLSKSANEHELRQQLRSQTSADNNSDVVISDKLGRLQMPPPNSPYVRRQKKGSSVTLDEPDTPDVNFKVPPYAHLPWRERVAKSVESLERNREQRKKDEGSIGSVMDKARREDKIHIKSKTVNFSWQRGNKIGQGHFGKVYTAINNETGDIMAMKEIPLQPNDHKTLRNVADELRIFESIHHKHLINHYGVEVHREEMLIFMEYCPEGTLEELVSTTEAGLEESSIRRYTRQLMEAVSTLHENGVVHRDIKGANIFLTDDMQNLKLGDFGCAVKIKAHTTMPGELQGFVGTQAYMAPEVFTKNMSEGHGRAADIWSCGCVVIEMATGKRPWFELESNYQIMFKVGMGESPPIPERLSREGKHFLGLCFEHDPRGRATAEDLLNQPFLKVYLEEENQSLPIFQSLADLGHDLKKLNLGRKASYY